MATKQPTDSSQPTPRGRECPECGGQVEQDKTEYVCQDCGLVDGRDALDRGPDWRSYNADAEQHAEPTNPHRQGKGLGTELPAKSGDRDHARRKRLHDRAKTETKRERNKRYAIGEIERVTSALELSESIRKQAVTLLKQVYDERGAQGLDLDALAATTVYTTTRVNQMGFSPSDFERVARSDEKTIARRHRWLTNLLDVPTPPPRPEDRIRRVAGELGLSDGVVDRALRRLECASEEDVGSGSPSTLAAALLWDSTELVSQREVAEAAGVTPAGLRQRLAGLECGGQASLVAW